MAEIKYDVVKEIGVLSQTANGWTKELNMVSWQERDPVYDLRTWSPDKERMGKGITFNAEEARELRDLLNSIDLD